MVVRSGNRSQSEYRILNKECRMSKLKELKPEEQGLGMTFFCLRPLTLDLRLSTACCAPKRKVLL